MSKEIKTVIYQSNKNHVQVSKPAYIFNNYKGVSDWILNSKEPELALIKWVEQFVNPDSIFLDIGAHVGTYTINLAPKCKKVYAFEAQRLTYYQLCGGIVLNNFTNVYAFNNGICGPDESGKILDLNIISEDGGGSTFDKSSIEPRNESILNTEKVFMKCIDDFDIEPNISLIKIDVENYELQVIQGCLNTIKKSNYPKILFETWVENWNVSKKENLFSFLTSIGYKIFPISGINNMFLASID
jgi:FkbM family methyltransferase